MADEQDLKMLDKRKAASEEIGQDQNEKVDPATVLWKENPDEFSSGNLPSCTSALSFSNRLKIFSQQGGLSAPL